MPKSIFEKIAQGEIPAYIIWQDEHFMAFLDIQPLAPGHTLVVPKQNWGDYVFDLSDTKYQQLWHAAKRVAGILKQKLACERVLVIVEGFEVPHVHIHLVPAHDATGLSNLHRQEVSAEELAQMKQQLTD